MCVLGSGVENEEGREGILVRIDVEGSGEKNDKNEIENSIVFCIMVLGLLLLLHF